MPAANRGAPSRRPRNTFSRHGASAAASAKVKAGSSPPSRAFARLVRDDDFAADEMDARLRVGLERRDGRSVLPPISGAIERVRGVAEERRDPEIRA